MQNWQVALPALANGKVAARCKDGILRIEAPPGFQIPVRLAGGTLHMSDIALFWGDTRVNAQQRAKAWQALARPGSDGSECDQVRWQVSARPCLAQPGPRPAAPFGCGSPARP